MDGVEVISAYTLRSYEKLDLGAQQEPKKSHESLFIIACQEKL